MMMMPRPDKCQKWHLFLQKKGEYSYTTSFMYWVSTFLQFGQVNEVVKWCIEHCKPSLSLSVLHFRTVLLPCPFVVQLTHLTCYPFKYHPVFLHPIQLALHVHSLAHPHTPEILKVSLHTLSKHLGFLASPS